MGTILVTGGAGFIGSNFSRFWIERHPEDRLVLLDSLTYAGSRAAVPDSERVDLVVADIRETGLVETVLREHRIDTIVHFAAESHVDRSIAGPDQFFQTNILGTASLLRAARQVWLEPPGAPRRHRFHHVSTDEVFGSLGAGAPAFTETSAYAPNSPYAASKAASDHLVRAYHRTFGLDVTTTNCSNNYGPYQYPEKLIPHLLLKALSGYPLPVYGDGTNVRDWIHVWDHCLAIEACLLRGEPGETYVVGGNCELTNLEVVGMLSAEIDHQFAVDRRLAQRFPHAPAARGVATRQQVILVEDRPGHDYRYAIDARKLAECLGIAPSRSFQEGLRQTVRWYLDNEQWWDRLATWRHDGPAIADTKAD